MKVLVFGLNWVGDVIMSFPAISLAAENEDAGVDVLTRPHLSPLYGYHPSVKNIWEVETKSQFWSLLPQFFKIRKKRYDLIAVFPGSLRARLFAYLCGGKERVGFKGESRGFFLTKVFPLPEGLEKMHESKIHSELIILSGLGNKSSFKLPKILFDESKVRKTLDFFHIRRFRDYVVIAPGAAFGEAKRWPAGRFSSLAKEIVRDLNFGVVATGSAGETELTHEVISGLGTMGLSIGGKTSLVQLLEIISRAKLLIANDSGTMHLGALAGVPMIIPVGPTDIVRTGPLSENAFFVMGKSCAPPCREKICRRKNYFCMNSITVQDMYEAVKRWV